MYVGSFTSIFAYALSLLEEELSFRFANSKRYTQRVYRVTSNVIKTRGKRMMSRRLRLRVLRELSFKNLFRTYSYDRREDIFQ